MPPTVIYIENYPPDGQRSMAQYADLCVRCLELAGGKALRLHPPVCFGRGRKTVTGAGKWAGYLDKYLLAPRSFQRRLAQLRTSGLKPDLVHVIDHSNAPYQNCFNGLPVRVTCHDLIAVRRALGEFPVARPPLTGRLQQHWIRSALRGVEKPAFVSTASKQDFIRLTGRMDPGNDWPVIYPAPGQKFAELDASTRQHRLTDAGLDLPDCYLHHHGGATWYKNREAVIEVFLRCRQKVRNLGLVFSGAALTFRQSERLRDAGVWQDCRDCGAVDTPILEAIYGGASVFVFPSWCEGFGWPPLEAQACGCPVVASRAGSLHETLGNSAMLADPDNIDAMAAAVIAILVDSQQARLLVERGRKNCARFSIEAMREALLAWYEPD